MFTDFSYETDDADAFLESIEEDDVLLSLGEIRSVYQPEDLRAMGAAYDMACAFSQVFLETMNEHVSNWRRLLFAL